MRHINGLWLFLILTFWSGVIQGAPAPLGVSYPCNRGDLAGADKHLARIDALGLKIVSFIPSYTYSGLNRLDFSEAPTFDEQGKAVELALRRGLQVVLKPHLEPAMYAPGFDSLKSENHSWRARVGWQTGGAGDGSGGATRTTPRRAARAGRGARRERSSWRDRCGTRTRWRAPPSAAASSIAS